MSKRKLASGWKFQHYRSEPCVMGRHVKFLIVRKFSTDARKANQALVVLINIIGKRHGAPPAQVALA